MISPTQHRSNAVLPAGNKPSSERSSGKSVLYLGNPEAAPVSSSAKLDPKKVKTQVHKTLESKRIYPALETDLAKTVNQTLQFSSEPKDPKNIDELYNNHISSLEEIEKRLADLEKEKKDLTEKLKNSESSIKKKNGDNEKLRNGILGRDITITTLAFFLATTLAAAAIAIPIIAVIPAAGPLILVGLIGLIVAPVLGAVVAGCTGGALAAVSDL